MNRPEKIYHSFLLRLWQAGAKEDQIWRFTLESPQSGEHWSFSNLEALVQFLKEQMKNDHS